VYFVTGIKGDFENKINKVFESGDLTKDISLLFPEYQGKSIIENMASDMIDSPSIT
jgi:hypothetical protein